MSFLNLYYVLKPLIPKRVQLGMRRRLVRYQSGRAAARWPIDSRTSDPPAGWTGWPEGKQFALVLTHDVETERGLQRCRALSEMEEN